MTARLAPEVARLNRIWWEIAAIVRGGGDLSWVDPHIVACAGEDPELWFPPPGANAARAKAICARCPLQPDCAEYGIAHAGRKAGGVWGGLTPDEREEIRRQRRAAA
jgi:WhiB family redox-sensing transcriptional regulator